MISEIAAFARLFLLRELERAGLARSMSPRVVNPRAQGWLAGFVLALGRAHQLDAAAQYELEARIYVALFDGTPMGEQLGLEALAMAKQLSVRAMMPDWDAHQRQGEDAGAHFAATMRAFEGFAAALS
jgi:hypothetical protein